LAGLVPAISFPISLLVGTAQLRLRAALAQKIADGIALEVVLSHIAPSRNAVFAHIHVSQRGKAMGSKPKRAAKQSSGPVSITYKKGNGPPIPLEAELLIVACDPTNLKPPICDYNTAELKIVNSFSKFTFQTSLLKVRRDPNAKLVHGVIFAPTPMDNMDGSIYAFRNESAKQFGLTLASGMRENWVTVYQLQGPRPTPWTSDDFRKALTKELKTLEWWPYGQDYDITDVFWTPYFNQFSPAGLQQKLPWQLLGLQGKRNTIYAHGSACFESVLHCWQYANMLLDPSNNLGVKLPERRDAPIVILGAGASGILFASRLRDMNYTNVEILELKDTTDGKIHTIVKDGPSPPGLNQPTVCELGACYLSPSYDDFVKYLGDRGFLKGNDRIPIAKYAEDADRFRGIWAWGQFPRWRRTAPREMNYSRYIIEKAKHDLGYPEGYKNNTHIELKLAEALVLYIGIHELFMGRTPPMPLTQPSPFNEFGSRAFEKLASDKDFKDLMALVGLFQYAYSVQGYGSLKTIPAYYVMTWITPPVIEGILAGDTVVTAWSKGWGDVWKQMQAGLKITRNATTLNITRPK
jgi:hypothetical protein